MCICVIPILLCGCILYTYFFILLLSYTDIEVTILCMVRIIFAKVFFIVAAMVPEGVTVFLYNGMFFG